MVDALPRCHGCGAAVGEQHDRVCDVARCRATGLQWDACDHTSTAPVPHEPDVWTGRWPGEEDCERLGWFARLEPGQGWVPCESDAPGAQPDINRLYAEAEWDPIAGLWKPKVDDTR
jgi:hypothetical protein